MEKCLARARDPSLRSASYFDASRLETVVLALG
jgi:hypothetical protein